MKTFLVSTLVIALLIFSCADSSIKNDPLFDTTIIKVGKGAGSVELADLNKDGNTDIVVANTEDNSVTILLGNGKGKFTEAPGSPVPANRFPNDIVIADLDHDGNPDLGIANTEVGLLTVLLGDGKGQFHQAAKSPFTIHSKPHTHGIATGDFNGDGNLDLVTDSWGVDSLIIVFGDGKGNFNGESFYKVGKHPYQRVRAADLNKDSKPDIVTTNLDGKNVTVLLGMGDGKFNESPGSPFPAGDTPFGIAIGDINGDGNPDLAIVNAPTITSDNKGKDGLTVLLGDGKGNFAPLKGSPFETGKSPSRVAIGDINGDGINDIAVTNYNDKSISIFYMSKNGMIESKLIKVGTHPDGIAVHDLNNDGKGDIVVSNFDENEIMIFFRK